MVVEHENRDSLGKWQRAAFIGWQRYSTLPRGEDAAPAMNFGEYLSMFGFNDEPELTDEEVLDEAREFMKLLGVDL